MVKLILMFAIDHHGALHGALHGASHGTLRSFMWCLVFEIAPCLVTRIRAAMRSPSTMNRTCEACQGVRGLTRQRKTLEHIEINSHTILRTIVFVKKRGNPKGNPCISKKGDFLNYKYLFALQNCKQDVNADRC